MKAVREGLVDNYEGCQGLEDNYEGCQGLEDNYEGCQGLEDNCDFQCAVLSLVMQNCRNAVSVC